MQATEAATGANETVLAPEARPDLDMSQYIPDFLQPVWDFLTPYPGILTLVLVVFAYLAGKLIKMVNRLKANEAP